MLELHQVRFNGQRDDIGSNYTSSEYLRVIENGNFDDIDGINKTLSPEQVVTSSGYLSEDNPDGGYEYRYLDDMNILQTEQIRVINDSVYTNVTINPTPIYTGLTPGKKCRFAVINDKLVITNGVDYPLIYWGVKGLVYEMGAPAVENSGQAGNPNGTYQYKITFVTAGGEEVLGTVSNSITVANRAITVNIPLGYTGTTSRKIYRTVTGGSVFKYLHTVPNNTDATYLDNISDGALTTTIPAINNQMPKPAFIEVSYFKLVGTCDGSFPTQIFIGETGVELFDAATFSDVSNVGNDNTPCVGMNQQFSQVVVATGKNWYLVDVSGTTALVQPTSVNIGCYDGYSIVNIPANEKFPGGVMFLSTLGDVRVLNGVTGLIAATINNVETENWAQVIKGSLDNELSAGINIDAFFFNYTYHLIIGSRIFLFNTKRNAWTTLRFMDNDNNSLIPLTLFQYGDDLYMTQEADSTLYRMYQDLQLNGVDYTATYQTAAIPVFPQQNGGFSISSEVKYFDEIQIYFVPSLRYPLEYRIIIDEDETNAITGSFDCPGGTFDVSYYDDATFDTASTGEDYRVVRIQRFGMYLSLEIKSVTGIVHWKGYKLTYSQESAVG